MNRRDAVVALLALGAAPFAAQAQQAGRVYRVGLVVPASRSEQHDAFRQKLRELGYIEGKNLIVEARYAEGRIERVPELVAEVIRLKVDVLVVGANTAAHAAKRATTVVPIVFAGVPDPVGTGLVASLGRPGGNITGISMAVGEGFAGKWVELLRDAVPGVSHAAALVNSASTDSGNYVKEMRAAARALNMKLDVFAAGNNPAELDEALAAIGASGARGLIVPADAFFFTHRAKLVQSAASKRLPAVYCDLAIADDGGLMAYGPSLVHAYRQVATHVDKILKGAKPSDLPIEQPTKFEFVINLKTAKTLGITMPQSVRLRADRVIE